MTFFDLPDEKRADWRNDEVTQAFLALLAKERAAVLENGRAATRANDHHNATLYVGQVEAFDWATKVANTRKDR
jgi:hypothetical protein